jgi:hypothetical protein
MGGFTLDPDRHPLIEQLVWMELGIDWDRIEDLKNAGAIA